MKTTHTPGPWTHETSLPVSVRLAPLFALGDIHPARGDTAWQEVAEANARLIAAAPELLAALEAAIPAMGVDISGIDVGAVITQARAALARAKL